MPLRIIVGVNWGDEGKGRMVDYFAKNADFVVRFQGGNNAGHTIENDFGNFKLHLIPSGIFYKNTVNLLGPGTVVNLEAAVNEMEGLQKRGIEINKDNYKISDRATICFPFHNLQDEYEETRLGQASFGSTRQGIAPVYGDRYMKYGVQVGALFYPEYLKQEIERCLQLKNKIFEKVYGKPAADPDETFRWAMKYGEILKPHICDSIALLKDARKAGKRVLLEGQLGALRDIIYGIYPYPTSSSTIAGFGAVGAGYFSREVPAVTGVMKAFSTCVGEGRRRNRPDETGFPVRAGDIENLYSLPRRFTHPGKFPHRAGTDSGGAGLHGNARLAGRHPGSPPIHTTARRRAEIRGKNRKTGGETNKICFGRPAPGSDGSEINLRILLGRVCNLE